MTLSKTRLTNEFTCRDVLQHEKYDEMFFQQVVTFSFFIFLSEPEDWHNVELVMFGIDSEKCKSRLSYLVQLGGKSFVELSVSQD